jgi:16S rRNA (guanine(966)-N(2))-methyltransferase RsmD
LRIISGYLKGRKIEPPEGLGIRPTTDRAREALFNILNNWVTWEDAEVLDLYCGSGAISLEFISRGAQTVYSIEKNKKTVTFLKSIQKSWEIKNWHIYCSKVEDALISWKEPVSVAFLDPPYQLGDKATLLQLLLMADWFASEGIVVLEHPVYENLDEQPHFFEKKVYGFSAFSFFKKK